MPGQRDQYDTSIPEKIALTPKFFGRRRLLPLNREIAGVLGVRRARGLDLLFMNDEARPMEKRVATAVVGMQMRADNDIDAVALQADASKTRDHVLAARHDRHHQFRE